VSYVESQLLSGETVLYRAHLHKIHFLVPVILALLALVSMMFVALGVPEMWIPAALFGVLAAGTGAWAWIGYKTSEFAVTNKRVVIKVGWVRRRSLETLLSKIEGIAVDQDILGRMLDYGTIAITGTGGTRESFPRIAAPLEFRRQVQDVVARLEETRASLTPAAGSAAVGVGRDERDCPFCAERILRKASVCKHCGRDVAGVGV
jgi:hypothetical protein